MISRIGDANSIRCPGAASLANHRRGVGRIEAVQKAEELKPDLIVLDISLHKLSGIEAEDTTTLPQLQNCLPKSEQGSGGREDCFEHRHSWLRSKDRCRTELLPAGCGSSRYNSSVAA
jgi:hypothetical protein